jgi:hypothetical protein
MIIYITLNPGAEPNDRELQRKRCIRSIRTIGSWKYVLIHDWQKTIIRSGWILRISILGRP